MSTLVTDLMESKNKRISKAVYGFVRRFCKKYVPNDVRQMCCQFAFVHISEIFDCFDVSAHYFAYDDNPAIDYSVTKNSIDFNDTEGKVLVAPLKLSIPNRYACTWIFDIRHYGAGAFVVGIGTYFCPQELVLQIAPTITHEHMAKGSDKMITSMCVIKVDIPKRIATMSIDGQDPLVPFEFNHLTKEPEYSLSIWVDPRKTPISIDLISAQLSESN